MTLHMTSAGAQHRALYNPVHSFTRVSCSIDVLLGAGNAEAMEASSRPFPPELAF